MTLPEVVYERRIHSENTGKRTPGQQRQSYLGALRLKLARHHAGENHTP